MSKMRYIQVSILIAFSLASFGCERQHLAGEGVGSKQEYSVLQALEYDYRALDQTQPVIIKTHVLSSAYNVVGFPKEGSPKGYVWLIANPVEEPLIKQLPVDAEFRLERANLEMIERKVDLNPEVKAYLFRRLR
jgi:hypothetical protein